MDIIQQFSNKYKVVDDELVNYNEETINELAKILNGNIQELYNNNVLLNYAGLYYEYELNDLKLAEKYYLMASVKGNTDSNKFGYNI